MTPELDEADERLLDSIQEGLPLCKRPYRALGEELGISEAEVVRRLKKLKDKRYIRRLGGVFSSKKLGYHSTLLAAKVEEEKFYEVAEAINRCPGVTHNYRRNHQFNMWFTLTAQTEDKLDDILSDIENLSGVESLRRLPAKRRFKLKVHMRMQQKEGDSDVS